MGKINQNVTMWKGDSVQIKILVDNVASVEDCTDAQWAMAVNATSTRLITKELDDDPVTITFSGKYVIIQLSPEDTDELSGIDAGTYYHECRLWDVAGKPTTPAIGTLTINPVINKN